MTTFTSEDRINSEPILESCRDTGMSTYTYFWTINKKVISPYFNTDSEANSWMDIEKYKIEAQSLWSDSCTTPRKNQ